MQLQVHSIQFKADVKLVNFIESKIEKLELFHDNIIDGEVYLRLEKNASGNKITEIKLNIPGKELFAKKQGKSFEEATDEAIDALKRQITKSKGKKALVH